MIFIQCDVSGLYDLMLALEKKSMQVATSQLLPWAIGRRSGIDVVPITDAVVSWCLLPVCFPLCSYIHWRCQTILPIGVLPTLSSAFVSRQFAIAGFEFDQLFARFWKDWECRPESPHDQNSIFGSMFAPVTSPRSNSLCLSIYLFIYLSVSISSLFSIYTHTRQQIREESNVNFFLHRHVDTYTRTRTFMHTYLRDKSPFKVVLHPPDRPMPAVDPSG